MECEEDDVNNAALNTLFNMFANVMSPDTIRAVVESYGGDLNLSIDAIMQITGEDGSDRVELVYENTASSSKPHLTASSPSKQISAPGAIPNQMVKSDSNFWTKQVQDIVANHRQGNRILILMRGAPGSGKSCLSKKLIEVMIGSTLLNYRTHIFSTDDFFIVKGKYEFSKYRLPEAHLWNQNRVQLALFQGLSPVIVDNTNIEPWELEPYVKAGTANGFIIEVVEPNTPWAKKSAQLTRKNIHNVPYATIKRMLDNYCEGLTGHSLMRSLGLSYPANMVPPVKRLIPALPKEQEEALKPHDNAKDNATKVNIKEETQLPSENVSTLDLQPHVLEQTEQHTDDNTNVFVENASNEVHELAGPSKKYDDIANEATPKEDLKQKLIMEAQKKFEEISSFEQEWENGANWDDDKQVEACTIGNASNSKSEQGELQMEPKPPRNYNMTELEQQCAKSLMLSDSAGHDWSKITMYMPQWNDGEASVDAVENVPVETTSSSTCMEFGDININGKNRVISATPRNINEFYTPSDKEKIPQMRKLDKSTTTNEQDMLTESARCKNEEKHFIAFRKLFKNIPRTDLRDIFDKCLGDVNWAVDIVLDGMTNRQFKSVDTEDLSDSDDQDIEQCECLSVYSIIPDSGATRDSVNTSAVVNTQEVSIESQALLKKSKKNPPLTEESILVKRQIEQNVVIADSHYSEHCLKIRKIRRGEYPNPSTSATPDTVTLEPEAGPALDSNTETSDNSDDESCGSAFADERIVTVILGKEMVAEIDKLFGRDDIEYPDYIVPKISLPLSTLNLLNASWMESVMHQMEYYSQLSADMIQQDEEFAKQLVLKEQELATAGKEPAVPDFKEIMDLDMAVALYQKDVAEWRNNLPNDMAGKMSREKLYNLFPEIEQDTLSELLMAHDNNFQATVEVLLISMGRHDILEQENGVSKFVMEKELQRQEKILKKEMKALTEKEWPLLPKGEVVDMSTVQSYRDEAEQHLYYRNLNYNKAQDFIHRGMTQVANYFSTTAAFHKQKFEQANSRAAAYLMQVHALKSPDSTTIDLHYLRVNEAKEALDLFLDTHIQILKESHSKGGARVNTLFFITGRGLHSPGKPRIKPAVKKRLSERGLTSRERNPGLLTSKVTSDDKLSYQVQAP